jgi:hypothetical protein
MDTYECQCPVCDRPAVLRCRCPRGALGVAAGHQWHTCTVHRRTVLGESDHSLDTFTCTCPDPAQVHRFGGIRRA